MQELEMVKVMISHTHTHIYIIFEFLEKYGNEDIVLWWFQFFNSISIHFLIEISDIRVGGKWEVSQY